MGAAPPVEGHHLRWSLAPRFAEEVPTGERPQHPGEASAVPRPTRPGTPPPRPRGGPIRGPVTPPRYGRRRWPATQAERRIRPRCCAGLTPSQRDAVVPDERPAVRAGRGRVGQDDGAHPPGGPPHRSTARPRPSTPWWSPSPARRRAELRSRLGGSACPARCRPARSTPSPSPQLRRHWADHEPGPRSWCRRPRILDARPWPGPVLDRAATVAAVAAEVALGPGAPGHRPRLPSAAARAGRSYRASVAEEVAGVLRRATSGRRRGEACSTSTTSSTTCAPLLEDDATAAAALRWRIRHLFVDEFQDVNPAQWRLLRAWLGDGHDLFVVGDPRQAVYGWNGADPTLLDRLPDLLPGTTSSGSTTTTAPRPRSSRPRRACSDPTPARATRPDGPGPVVTGSRRRRGRGGRRGPLAAPRPPARAPLVPSGRAGPDQRPPRARRRAPSPAPASPTGPAAGANELRRALDALAELRRVPPPAPAQRPGRAGRGRRGARVEPRPAAAAGLARHAWPWLGSPTSTPSNSRTPPWASSSTGWPPADDGATGARAPPDGVELSTFHRAKGLEWPAVALVGLEDGHGAHRLRHDPRRPRRGAPPALRGAHPRRGRAVVLVGAPAVQR